MPYTIARQRRSGRAEGVADSPEDAFRYLSTRVAVGPSVPALVFGWLGGEHAAAA